jgi:hypothetical protein
MLINIIAIIMATLGTIVVWKESTVKKYNIIVKYIIIPVVAFIVWKYVLTGIVASIMGIIHLITYIIGGLI